MKTLFSAPIIIGKSMMLPSVITQEKKHMKKIPGLGKMGSSEVTTGNKKTIQPLNTETVNVYCFLNLLFLAGLHMFSVLIA